MKTRPLWETPGRELLDYDAIANGLTKIEARVMEQLQINKNGLKGKGGTLLNEINSISEKYWPKHDIPLK